MSVFTSLGRGGAGLPVLDQFTFTGAEATKTFLNIPQTYTDLILVFNGRSARAAQVLSSVGLRFNGVANVASYYTQHINASGATVNGSSNAADVDYLLNVTIPAASAVASYPAHIDLTIPDYSKTALHKLVRGSLIHTQAASAAGHTIREIGGHFLSSEVISSLEFFDVNGANFVAGSTLYLRGR